MNSRPSVLPISPAFWRNCCGALLALSINAAALPPGAGRGDAPGVPDNRTITPQTQGTNTVAFTTSMEVLNDSTKLGAGDRVSFRVIEDRHEPISLVVTDSGEMEVPLIGRVKALNKTCKQLAYELKPLFEKEYFVKATVIVGLDLVGTKSRGKVYITGQVRAPGALELMPGDPVTLSQAILRAGSLGDFADKKHVRLVRKKENVPPPKAVRAKNASTKDAKRKPNVIARMFGAREDLSNDSTDTYIVDLVEILEKGHLELDPELKVGDLIYVPERLINF